MLENNTKVLGNDDADVNNQKSRNYKEENIMSYLKRFSSLVALIPTLRAGLSLLMYKETPVSEIKDNLIPAFLKICDWLRSNELSLNTVKTEFMVIGSQNKLNNMDSDPVITPYLISIDGFTIKRTKVVKYLGLVVDDALTWSQQVFSCDVSLTLKISIFAAHYLLFV